MTGIEDINLYGGRLSLSIFELAEARGKTPDYVRTNLMCDTRSLFPAWEDAVTQSVNAARPLVDRTGVAEIDLLIVATESSVDFGKPVSTWVHRYCGLKENCRSFEMKHACYGGTAALKMASAWVRQNGGRALVVSADTSRVHLGDQMEYICGGCAVAMIVSDTADILAFDPGRAGYWTTEIADTFRPTSREEIGNDQLSLYAYLDALEGSFNHYETRYGPLDYQEEFARHIYHAPFPAMTWQAHRRLLARCEMDKNQKRSDFERKVAPGLRFSRRIGTSYGASNFVCLLGLLAGPEASADTDLSGGEPVSLFAYGSGCQGEFYGGQIGNEARDKVRRLDIPGHLDARTPLTMDQYEALEREREKVIEVREADLSPSSRPLFEEAYRGEGLLILEAIEDFKRSYTWS